MDRAQGRHLHASALYWVLMGPLLTRRLATLPWPLRSMRALGLTLAMAAPASASAQLIAPARGATGPGTGLSTQGGPGDRDPGTTTPPPPWRRWWNFNQDPYLARLRSPAALPVRAAPLRTTTVRTNPRRPPAGVTYGEVYPALVEALAATKDADLQASCLLALAKIGAPPAPVRRSLQVPPISELLLPAVSAASERVRDLAVLSLGITGDASFAPLLASIARDTREGRDAVRGGRIDRRTRAFATHALGLLGASTDRRAVRALVEHELRAIATENLESADLIVAAVIGLGWCPLPMQVQAEGEPPLPGSREATVRALLDLDPQRKMDFRGRAQLPMAVARLLAAPLELSTDPAAAGARIQDLRAEVVGAFTARLHGPQAEKLAVVREGLAQALGLLVLDQASTTDTAAIEALTAVAKEGRETEAMFSMVALARICGRASTERGQTARTLRQLLTRLAIDGSTAQQAPALLALGVAEDRGQALGRDPALGTRAFLARRATAGSPSPATAAAVALGLTGERSLAPSLRAGLTQGNFQDRGARAIAVAMLGDEAGLALIREELRRPLYRPYLTRDFATALALSGDPLLGPLLVDRLVHATFIPERVAAVQAFEWSTAPESASAMLFVLTERRLGSKRIDDTSRAFAASALGNLCAREPLPWNTRLALDVVWNAAPPSLTDARNGGGVLDVL